MMEQKWNTKLQKLNFILHVFQAKHQWITKHWLNVLEPEREREREKKEREREEKMRDGALSVNSMRAFIVSEQFRVKYFVVIFMENPTLCNLIHAWDGSWLVKLEFVIWNYNTLIFDPSRVTNAPFVRSCIVAMGPWCR